MCGGGPKPKPKPKPKQQAPAAKPVATPAVEPIAAGPTAQPEVRESFSKKKSRGRRKTILTSSLGIGEEPNIGKKTLLGG